LGDVVSFWGDALASGWRSVEDGAAHLVGEKGPSDVEAEQRTSDDATRKGRDRSAELHDQSSKLKQESPGGTDPKAITTRTNWDSWEHSKIKSMADGLSPAEMTGHGDAWIKLGKGIADDFETFHREVTGAITGNWEGEAAEMAKAAPQGIVSWGKGFGAALQDTGTQVQVAAAAAEQTKATVPPPKDFNWRTTVVGGLATLPVGGVGALVDAQQQHQEQQTEKAKAVRVMQAVYTPGYTDVDGATPTFAVPTDPTRPPGQTPPPPPPVHPPPVVPPQPRQPGPVQPRGRVGDQSQPGPGPHPNPPSQQQPTPPVQPGPPSYPPGPNPNPPGPNPNPPVRVGPPHREISTDLSDAITQPGPVRHDPFPGWQQPSQHGVGGSGSGSFGPIGSGGVGGGSSSGGADRGYSGTGQGVGNRAGVGGLPAGEPGIRAAGVAGKPGAAGASGGAMGGGQGRKKEEDKEHRTAAYLVNEDNGNEIVGDLPPTVPPVIGG
jgi:PPE family